jgi:hypothetical protein
VWRPRPELGDMLQEGEDEEEEKEEKCCTYDSQNILFA